MRQKFETNRAYIFFFHLEIGSDDLETFQARGEFRISTSGVFPLPRGRSIQIWHALTLICPFRSSLHLYHAARMHYWCHQKSSRLQFVQSPCNYSTRNQIEQTKNPFRTALFSVRVRSQPSRIIVVIYNFFPLKAQLKQTNELLGISFAPPT